jgi:hypothetical protein
MRFLKKEFQKKIQTSNDEGEFFTFKEISVLTAISVEDLEESYGDEPNQFISDFIEVLENPLEYDGCDGNYYTFDEIAEIIGESKAELYDFYINNTHMFLEDFK